MPGQRRVRRDARLPRPQEGERQAVPRRAGLLGVGGRDSLGLHFTWRPRPDAVDRVVPELEAALAPSRARPHWGKVFSAGAAEIATLYDRHADFVRLVDRMDPRGTFGNRWLERHVLGAR